MKLLFIRHAIAQSREEFQRAAATEAERNDDLRPLTEVGAKKMRQNAKGLARLVSQPSLLASSPLVRAKQTSAIVRTALKPDVYTICEFLRPGSQPSEFLRWLKMQPQIDDTDSLIAIVGHEPHLSVLASWFVHGQAANSFDFKKGGACLMDFSHDGYKKACGQVLWVATPAMLRGLV